MTTCNQVMCKYGLNTANDVKKWLLKNHPDKGGKIKPDEFNKVIECYQYAHRDGSKGIFYDDDTSANKSKQDKSKKKTNRPDRSNTKRREYRRKVFNCMRKTANFSKINLYHKFDKPNFSPVDFNKTLLEASPKLVRLLNNIKELDRLDIKNHGKVFKHFIFSDVKEGGSGAKIIASALSANGFINVVKAGKVPRQQRLRLYLDTSGSSRNKFALLCSNSVYNTNFNEKIKREILTQFNKRPDNINGKQFRFVILDSGFKEGIDLFDVKYVHIFEPSTTIADLKQTVGRATRTCGQKGLDFIPNIGWPLYVYNYYLTVPDVTQESLYLPASSVKNISEKNPDIDPESDYFLFKDATTTKSTSRLHDATMKFSEFDKAMTNLSQQLFYLAPQLAVDYSLTSRLHNIEDLNSSLFDNEVPYLKGGAKNSKKVRDPTKHLQRINRGTKYFNIDLINCRGKCGDKTTRDVPVSLDFLYRVYNLYGHPRREIPKSRRRQYFCQYMRENPLYCEQINHEWSLRYSRIPDIIETNRGQQQIVERLEDLEMRIDDGGDLDDPTEREYKILEYGGTNTRTNANARTNARRDRVPRNRLGFKAMRDFIQSNYNSRGYKWAKIEIENRCIEKKQDTTTNTNNNTNNNTNTNSKNNSSIEFNPTQQFLIDYFVPESPYKGILAWHSVGTGKTCTGVATASSTFERQGYNILWITRTTLKGDVWKNIFDQICHTILSYEVENGLVLPEKLTDRKRLLSDKWLEPMSYKQFSNLLSGKNSIYEILRSRNGSEDILRKTLLIIDEAHKLYGGDLKPAERPDVEVMERLIMNSYRKSGNDSCRLLLMTATPITNSPMELFNLTNLFFKDDEDKITTNPAKFRQEYMTDRNILSDKGITKIANALAGSISYLNRERDPTQFAQPIMINIPAIMTHVSNQNRNQDKELRDMVFLNKKVENAETNIKELIKEIKGKTKQLKREITSLRSIQKQTKKVGKEYCKNTHPGQKEKTKRDDCLKKLDVDIKALEREIVRLVEELNGLLQESMSLENTSDDVKTMNKEIQERVKVIKRSLLQEYILFKKCGYLGYLAGKRGNRPARDTYSYLAE